MIYTYVYIYIYHFISPKLHKNHLSPIIETTIHSGRSTGWNLQPSPMNWKEHDLKQTSMIYTLKIHMEHKSWRFGRSFSFSKCVICIGSMLIFHDFQPLIKPGLMPYPGVDAGEAQIFEQLGIIVLCLDFFCPFFWLTIARWHPPPPQ